MSSTVATARIATLILLLTAASARLLRAQDTRTVTEPTFPISCTVLTAQLTIAGGEPSSETAFDTSSIQSALNNCGSGKAVELTTSGSNNAFLIRPITIPTGVTLLIDAGVTVFASRNPADYQKGTVSATQEACGTIGTSGNGCLPLIGSTGTSGSGVMGYGVINGRGPDNLIVNGVVQNYSWYSNTLLSYTTNPQGSQSNPNMISTTSASSFTLYKITIKNSPHFNVHWSGSNGSSTVTHGLTVWGIKIISPYNIPNTDGIDPTDNAADITIANSFISNGDDQVAIDATAANNPISNISVHDVHTYSGRGISIGSGTEGGVSNVLFDTINQAGYASDPNGNGFRIKSSADRGGVVNNITYQHICQKDETYAIRFTPFYTTPVNTNYIPSYTNIAVRNVTILANASGGAGSFTFQGYDANHATTLTLDNLNVLGTPDLKANKPEYVTLALGPGPVGPLSLQQITGTGVTTSSNISNPAEVAYACSSSNFQQMTGELFLSKASVTNLQSLISTYPAAITLSAVIQPASSEYPALINAITFYDGSTAVGNASIGGNGNLATLNLSNVAGGTHVYTAQYPADSNYSAFTFGSTTVNVTPNATFTVTPTPSSLTLNAGTSGTSSLVITSVAGFAGAVSISCASPVTYVTCAATLPGALIGGGTSSATATIAVAATYARLVPPGVAQRPLTLALLTPLGTLLLLPLGKRRRRSIGSLLIFATFVFSMNGCSGSSGAGDGGSTGTPIPHGTQTLTLTSTGRGTAITTTLTVTIN